MRARLMVYALLASAYFLTYFFRISSAILLPGLGAEWGLGPAGLGLISSLYFYAYALAQPFCGLLNDRYGPTRVVPAALVVTGLGALAMGRAETPLAFAVGRAIVGFGVAPMLSGVLSFQSRAFPTAMYTTLSGITFATGNFGSVASVAPLGAATGAWGRGPVFAGLAAGGAIVAAILAAMGRIDPARVSRGGKASIGGAAAGLAAAFGKTLGSRRLRGVLLVWCVYFGSLMALQGLWAVSWYSSAFGLDRGDAGAWATLIGIGVVAGALVGGWAWKPASARLSALRFSFGAYAAAFSLHWLSLAWGGSVALTGCLGFMIGFSGGFCTDHLTAALNDVVGPDRAGSTFGAMNAMIFAAIIAYQSGTGFLLSRGDGPSFAPVFGIVAATLIPGLFALVRLGRFDAPEESPSAASRAP